MAPREEVNDIVQNFVDNDLVSLDRIGGLSDSFSLSPHLAQPSPDLALQSDYISPKTDQQLGKVAPATQSGSSNSMMNNNIASNETNFVTRGNDDESLDVSQSVSISKDTPQSSNKEDKNSEHSRGNSEILNSRHVSTSSITSVTTVEREKRASLGDRFKRFGKRIASSSSKK